MAARPLGPGPARPLSPHLGIWKWQVHAITSIVHRITGNAMALGAMWLFLWWLVAAATGREAYDSFYDVATGWFGMVIGIGCTWLFFQHLASGLRHLVMDTGVGYGLDVSKRSAGLTFVVSATLTLGVWAFILFGKGV